VDDIVICSRSHDEHEFHMRQVLQAMQDNGLVINAEKCMWGVPELEYLAIRFWRQACCSSPPTLLSSRSFLDLPSSRSSRLTGDGQLLQEIPAQHRLHASTNHRRTAWQQEGVGED
jgi:hypothetical protein